MAGILRALIERSQQKEDEVKRMDQAAKAADAYRASLTPDQQSALGTDENWDHYMTTKDKVAAMQGHGAAVKVNETLQQIKDYGAQEAERQAIAKQRGAAADADAQTGPAIGYAAEQMSPRMTVPDLQQYYDTTSAEQPDKIATGAPAMSHPQAIAEMMRRFPAAAGSRNFNASWKAVMDYGAQAEARTQGVADEKTIGQFVKNYMTAPVPSSGDWAGEAPDAAPYAGIEGRFRWAAEQTPNFSGRHLPRAIEALSKYSAAAGKPGADETPKLTFLGDSKIPVVTMGKTMQIDPAYGINLRQQGQSDLLDQKSANKPASGLIPATNPATGEAMPGYFFDQTGKLHDLRDQMTKLLGDRAPASGGPSAASPKPASTAAFDSEQAARAAGKKSGDVVTLTGIGKVRLK